jgi:O-antigen ligase/tetratricopeptide (TPR) repeat protein
MVVLLIVLAPLPEGSAYPWALPLIEVLVFGLVAAWQLTTALDRGPRTPFSPARPLLLPLLLFMTLMTLQLVSLPPAALRIVSPTTYRLYEMSLPGWPREQSDQILTPHASRSDRSQWSVLPTLSEVAGVVKAPFAPSRSAADRQVARLSGDQVRTLSLWRPLSIAPSMTEGVLLALAEYAALFFLVLLHPFGPAGLETERRVCRAIMLAALLSGLIVGMVGIIEFFTWNGKILWLFVPYDWGAPHPDDFARATGPFVNPDHFGDYLALVLPLAVGGALFRSDLFTQQHAFRVFSGVTAFMIVSALLLSLSRAAWVATAIAVAVLFALSRKMAEAARPSALSPERGKLLRPISVTVFAAIAFSLLFIGPRGRRQVDVRLQETVQSDSGVPFRLQLVKETLAIVRAYPVLGVGLGCWPEAFPQYRQPPWDPVIRREAHNDYAQLLAETGILGFALAAWFFYAIGRRLYYALGKSNGPPTLAAICAGLAVITVHEFVDFSLHTPANAVLLTVLLALACRIAMRSNSDRRTAFCPDLGQRLGAGFLSAFAVVMMICALRQDKIPYPYNIRKPEAVGAAITLISAHPAESALHLDRVRLAGEQLSPQVRLRELQVAVMLDPTNPDTRDLYAQALSQEGMTAQALDEISRSVLISPALATHFYLRERLIPWLSVPEREAVEWGFKNAVGRKYEGAVYSLGGFYSALGRFTDAGDTYGRAAMDERDQSRREAYLVAAGLAYVRAGKVENAEKFFSEAIRIEPADDRSYRYMTTLVLGPRHELRVAQKLVAEGVRAGADGLALYDALAEAGKNDGDLQLTEDALRGAVDARPSFTTLFRLGIFYLDEKKYDRAALIMRRAIGTNPGSGDAYFYLGVAEESDYRFDEAERDLLRATQLVPTNAGYRAHFVEFERKVQQSGPQPLRWDN